MTLFNYSGIVVRYSEDCDLGAKTFSRRIYTPAENSEDAISSIMDKYRSDESRWTPYRTSDKFSKDNVEVIDVRRETPSDEWLIKRVFSGS